MAQRGRKRTMVSKATLVLFVVLGVVAGIRATVRPVIVQGVSMEPTLRDGQRVWVTNAYWLVGPVQRRDLVLIQAPNGDLLIKRVFREGGQAVDWADPGATTVAGRSLVPERTVFVLGDNLANSIDSRDFGAIPVTRVRGKVFLH
ncbi:MAG: S26 family signal peptidase [Fimbriimonadaceae bacterium]|nr:S26 family signal peptidase [Fimbriimonadaceae bacterium]